jgi:hypothetical protein
MKKPREKKTEVDLTTLLSPEQLMDGVPDNDCFGKEWNPQDGDCALCHDVEICGIVKQSAIQKRVKAVEKKKGPMLDQTAFEKVPQEKIAATLRNWAADDDPASYEELEETIGKAASTKDKVAIREYIKAFLPRHALTITEEKTIIPYESIDNNEGQGQPATPEDSYPGSGVSS